MAVTIKKDYEDSVTNAQQALDSHNATQPAAYSSNYQDQLNSLYDQISNRQPFSYNVNEDALYNQYKNQYIRNGKLSMMDTMGQAQAMTGGYGSSYAQQVGQQAYNSYLAGLNDKVPELYQQAYSMYQDEGNNLKDLYSLAGDREAQDYSRYQDNLNLWLNDRSYYQNNLDNAQDRLYQAERDAVDDQQYEDSKLASAAALMAQYGDFSLYQQLYGLSDEQLQKMIDAWNAANTPVETYGSGSGSTSQNDSSTVNGSTWQQYLASQASEAKSQGATNEEVTKYVTEATSKILSGAPSSVVNMYTDKILGTSSTNTGTRYVTTALPSKKK